MLQIIVIYLGPGLLGMNNPGPPAPADGWWRRWWLFAINYACYFLRSTAAALRCPRAD